MGNSFRESRQAATYIEKVRQDSNKKLPLAGLVSIVTVRGTVMRAWVAGLLAGDE